jgi:hypothetical protein
MLEHVVEPLPPHAFAPRGLGDVERVVECGLHRGARVEEHGSQPRARRQIRHEPGAHDRAHAAVAQVQHAGLRVLGGLVRREHDVDPVRGHETAHFGRRFAIRHQRDGRRRIAPRPCQRVHHVEAGGHNEHHRHVDARLQIGAVRTGGHHHVGPARAGRGDFVRGVFVTARDDAQVGALDVFRRDVAEQVAQAADADGPHARSRAGFGKAIHEDGTLTARCCRDGRGSSLIMDYVLRF